MASRMYNPGFLTDDELAAAFCVRTSEFESIVETLQDNTGNSNQHLIVIGPRGSGKTNLLLRVALEVRRQADLADRLLPVVFSEESYVVSTCGEFWLECLARLAGQESEAPEERDLHATYRDLHAIQDEQTLAQRCLGAVLDVADRAGKRLVLVVENLNMLLGEMADPDAGWQLRKTLQTEPRIMLLGSATSRFAEIDDPDHALYDLFRIITLRPLDEQECATLWRAVSGASADRGKIRSLQILTGGSPRLMAIVARFGAELSFPALMADLFDLVDAHTEYFKRHIEDMPPQERRVFLALAELWRPATTREIADQARIGASQCSAQLQRLAARRAVAVHGGTPRRKQYYLVERMYNIYYLLRRGDPGRVVEALLRFMASFYSAPELSSIAGSMIVDALLTRPRNQALPGGGVGEHFRGQQQVPDAHVRAVTGQAAHQERLAVGQRPGACRCFTDAERCRYGGIRAMSTELTTLLGVVGAVATMLAVLLPVVRAQGTSLRREITAQGESLRREISAQGEGLRREITVQGESVRREIDTLRGDVAETRQDVTELRRNVHDLSDRVSRIEGLLNVPARSTNGAPAPAGGDGDGEANE